MLIGLERQWRQRSAGLHTCALVATGATLFALLVPVAVGSGPIDMRVIANIVSGVGFLAGGVILRDGVTVRGLNTAATIWATAAVGALAGIGLDWEAATGAAVIVGLNLFLQPVVGLVDRFSHPESRETAYRLTVTCTATVVPAVRAKIVDVVSDTTLALRSLTDETEGQDVAVYAGLLLVARSDRLIEKLAGELRLEPGVHRVAWRSDDAA